MNSEIETILIDDLAVNAVEHLTEDQVRKVYDKLSEIDKTSTNNLTAAEKETESSNYTTEDNNVIEAKDLIPGVDAVPENIAEEIHENENDVKSALDAYDFDEETTIQLIKVIEEYKAGNTSSLYSRLPKTIQDMVSSMVAIEAPNGATIKELNTLRNGTAKMLVDNFINDAKMSAALDSFNSELADTINEMNTEYDNLLGDAIDNVFNKIEEIRAEDPEHAKTVETIKDAFDNATTFEKQLEFANHTSPKKFNKFLDRYKDDVYYFNKKVNNNTVGVKVPNIEEIEPIIKAALPQYTEEDIKKFIICICRTIENTDELACVAYEYRMISSIYKYKFVTIDEKGEVVFENISKVIDAILS